MPDIQVTDQLDKPVESIKVDLAHPSSLLKYLKSEVLHLAVVPDFLDRKDERLSQAGTKPIQFQATLQHKFQLGNTQPEIDITPSLQTTIRANASSGSNLFDNDPFRVAAQVPGKTGYVSVAFQGSLDLGVSGSDGDLTFGFDKTNTVSLEYLKAFSLVSNEPTLGDALGQTISSYVIPADVSDLASLGINDIATVSGQGSLKVSGAMKVTAFPNPLASADLPLGAGTIAVKAGPAAGLSASFAISGSYQIRVRRKDADTVELSVLKEHGTTLKVDVSASAGITAKLGDTDLLAAILGAISKAPTGDKSLLTDLSPDELKALTTAIKGGLDHSLQASIDIALSALADDQAAFQYEIQPSRLNSEASLAVHKALDGDLSLLTGLEEGMQKGGILAPGVRMLNSVFSSTRDHGVTLKLNLLGILNFLTVSELIRKSEIVTDSVTGDVTIKETVTGSSISAISDLLARQEALRKAIFDSVQTTTTYLASKAVALPGISCEQVHFALSQNANHQVMSDYLGWFIPLNLLTAQDKGTLLGRFVDGGPATCVLRTSFGSAESNSMFFDASGKLWDMQHYLEIAREALRALLDPQHQTIDQLRYRIVDSDLWPTALQTGANVNLGPLVGLGTDDPRVGVLVGDVFVITFWAKAMVDVGALVQSMQQFVGKADVATLLENNEFKGRREQLQNKLAQMVKSSKMRFDEPWGMICLYWAAGSPKTAYGKISSRGLQLLKGALP